MTDEVDGVIRSMSSRSLAFAAVDGQADPVPISSLNGCGEDLALGARVSVTIAEDGSVLNWRPARRRFPDAHVYAADAGGVEPHSPDLPPAA